MGTMGEGTGLLTLFKKLAWYEKHYSTDIQRQD